MAPNRRLDRPRGHPFGLRAGEVVGAVADDATRRSSSTGSRSARRWRDDVLGDDDHAVGPGDGPTKVAAVVAPQLAVGLVVADLVGDDVLHGDHRAGGPPLPGVPRELPVGLERAVEDVGVDLEHRVGPVDHPQLDAWVIERLAGVGGDRAGDADGDRGDVVAVGEGGDQRHGLHLGAHLGGTEAGAVDGDLQPLDLRPGRPQLEAEGALGAVVGLVEHQRERGVAVVEPGPGGLVADGVGLGEGEVVGPRHVGAAVEHGDEAPSLHPQGVVGHRELLLGDAEAGVHEAGLSGQRPPGDDRGTAGGSVDDDGLRRRLCRPQSLRDAGLVVVGDLVVAREVALGERQVGGVVRQERDHADAHVGVDHRHDPVEEARRHDHRLVDDEQVAAGVAGDDVVEERREVGGAAQRDRQGRVGLLGCEDEVDARMGGLDRSHRRHHRRSVDAAVHHGDRQDRRVGSRGVDRVAHPERTHARSSSTWPAIWRCGRQPSRCSAASMVQEAARTSPWR